MQYHWVVMYDQETGTFDIDWDMTYQVLDGVVFEPEENEWTMPYDHEDGIYDTLSIHLENSLDKHFTL